MTSRSGFLGPIAAIGARWCCTASVWPASRRRRMAKRQAGFTLLELMVELVVLGFLMVGLTEGSRFGFRAWKHQSDTIADHDQMDAIDRTLRQLLTQVQMRAATEPGEIAFTGTLPAAVALGTRRADM